MNKSRPSYPSGSTSSNSSLLFVVVLALAVLACVFLFQKKNAINQPFINFLLPKESTK